MCTAHLHPGVLLRRLGRCIGTGHTNVQVGNPFWSSVPAVLQMGERLYGAPVGSLGPACCCISGGRIVEHSSVMSVVVSHLRWPVSLGYYLCM